ncbi:MAG: hypothetical protein IH870_04115, partial [Chloroflexi bacterium]|nr:hypothetical protein [Chloroflexota bacterium]
MLNGGLLQVTGRGSNVNFTIDDRAPFEAVIAGVEECLVKNRHLFSKGNITVNVGRRILAREQLTQIKRVLEAESGLTVAQFWCSPEILEETLSNAGPEQPPEALDKDTPIKSQGLPENQPESEIPPDQLGLARSDLDRSEEPDEARDSPGQTLRWPTPGLPAIPKPVSSIPPFAEKGGTVETKGEPLPAERFTPLSKDPFGPLPFGYNTSFAAPDIPVRGRGGSRLTLDLVGQMDTALRVLNPGSFVTSREQVAIRALTNQLKGSEFFGEPIDTVGPGGVVSRTVQLARDLFSPIGPGQFVEGLAREHLPGVASVIPEAEGR